MTLIAQNVGQIQALFIGLTAPTNTAILWYNTNPGIFVHYYYDTNTSGWVPLNSSSTGETIKEKAAAVVATTGNESAVTYDPSGKTITVNAAEGVIKIDDFTLSLNQRVLWGGNGVADVKNGLYIVTTIGSVSIPWVLTRSADSNTSSNISSGEIVPVLNGTINQGISFILTSDVPFSLNTSQLKYTAFSVFYKRTNPTTIAVGGLAKGSYISGTLQSTLDKILFPFQLPDFSLFSMSGQSEVSELGSPINGGSTSAVFNWSTDNASNITPNSISIIDVTLGNVVLGSSLANDGTETLTISNTPIPSQTSHQFKIKATDLNSNNFEKLLNLTWLNRRCYFISSTDYITPASNDSTISSKLNSLTLTTEYELNATRQMSKSFSVTSGYIYFVWVDSLGGDENIFTVNGFPSNSWLYKTFSYTNSFGVVSNFRIFRSLNILSTNFNITVS